MSVFYYNGFLFCRHNSGCFWINDLANRSAFTETVLPGKATIGVSLASADIDAHDNDGCWSNGRSC